MTIKTLNIKKLKRSFKTEYASIPPHWLEDWLLHIIEKPSSFLISNDDYTLTVDEMSTWLTGLEKMQSGTPLAYLTGQQEFWSLPFLVNEHTLIPRPDTEVLVEYVLQWVSQNIDKTIQSNHEKLKLLDLGTGTGCIAISLARELPNWQVTAIDFSKQALEVAEQNVKLNKVSNISLLQSSWYQSLPIPQNEAEKFAVIVSNPPYIDNQDKHLEKLSAEPLSALVADSNGLADIEQIIIGSKNHVMSGGLLVLEHGYNQAKAVQKIFSKQGFSFIETIQDYGGNDRITVGTFIDLPFI